VLEPMPSFIKIPLTESQKKLLQTKELTTMVEPEMKIALSGILSKGEPYYLCMDPMDLENLIEMIYNVANHEAKSPKMVTQFDQLSAYLANFLGKE
jgi:hypothetical protein